MLIQINRDVGLVSTLVTGVDLVLVACWLRGSKARDGKLGNAPLHRRVLFPAAGLVLWVNMMLQILCSAVLEFTLFTVVFRRLVLLLIFCLFGHVFTLVTGVS